MISRRTFLGVTTAALAGTACETGLGRTSEEKLPASVAALGPYQGEVKPITVKEREERIEKARRLMRKNGIAAMVLTGGTSLRYFTNIRWGLSERLLAAVIPLKGKSFLVTPAFERDRALEQVEKGPLRGDAEVYTWEEHENPYKLLVMGLRDRGARSGKLGIEETVRFVFSDGIAHAGPAYDLVSATPVTAGCRGVKTQHEIELMRLASAITLKAYEATYNALEEGMTQDDVARLVSEAHRRQGYSGGAGVQVGEYSALPHGSATPQTIREGTILLLDGGCSVEGYRSDISRTFVLGQPTDKMKQVFDIEFRAQTAALEKAAPGVQCQEVDAAARKVIEDAGYGPGYTYFTHRVGHGIGMDGHEWPYLVKGNTLPLEPGMTFSDEPGIYIPGEFGVRLEDDMVITESGAELLTPQSPSLENPFGSSA